MAAAVVLVVAVGCTGASEAPVTQATGGVAHRSTATKERAEPFTLMLVTDDAVDPGSGRLRGLGLNLNFRRWCPK